MRIQADLTLQANVYEEALREIGSWLCYYDARTHYELYGFAGALDGDKDNCDLFSLHQATGHKMFQIGFSSYSGLEVRSQFLN